MSLCRFTVILVNHHSQTHLQQIEAGNRINASLELTPLLSLKTDLGGRYGYRIVLSWRDLYLIRME